MAAKLKWVGIALVIIVIIVAVGISIYSVLPTLFYRMQSQVYVPSSQEALQQEGKGAPSVQRMEQAPAEKPKQDRLIIKNKSIRLEVKSVKESYSRIEKIAARYQGLIVSSQIYSDNIYGNGPVPLEKTLTQRISKPLSAVITIKVPVDDFERAIRDLKKLGELKSEQETTEEVTERHIDLTARLRNLQRQETRYLEILDLAKNVEEVLKVENEITRIRGEIESLQAQVDYLERSASMATITLELSEPRPITEPVWKWGLKDAVIRALKNFVAVINSLIIITGTLLPLVILGLFIWLGVYLVRKSRRRAV